MLATSRRWRVTHSTVCTESRALSLSFRPTERKSQETVNSDGRNPLRSRRVCRSSHAGSQWCKNNTEKSKHFLTMLIYRRMFCKTRRSSMWFIGWSIGKPDTEHSFSVATFTPSLASRFRRLLNIPTSIWIVTISLKWGPSNGAD